MTVAICALAWNHAYITATWLHTVQRNSSGHDIKLFLGDNGSTDNHESWNLIRGVHPEVAWRNEANESIHRGWNRLLQDALAHDPELICLSNNDLLVSPGWLDPILREVRKDARLGALRYFLPNGDFKNDVTFEQEAAEKAKNLEGQTCHGEAGWCLFFTPAAVREFLPIPEELQLWYGDDYMHWKLAAAGYQCVTVLDCCILHRGSVSVNVRKDLAEVVAKDRATFNRITGRNL